MYGGCLLCPLYPLLIYVLSMIYVRLTIRVKVGIPGSFKVGWYPHKITGSSHLKVTRFYLILPCKQHNWTSGTYSIDIIDSTNNYYTHYYRWHWVDFIKKTQLHNSLQFSTITHFLLTIITHVGVPNGVNTVLMQHWLLFLNNSNPI